MKKNNLPILIATLVMVLSFAGIIVSVVVGSRDLRQYNQYITAGNRALSAKAYPEAIDNYMKALELAPGNKSAVGNVDRAYRNWAEYVADDDLLLAAEVRDQEADELEAFNENVHSGEIRRIVSSARHEADVFRDADEEDPLALIDPNDPSDPSDPNAPDPGDPNSGNMDPVDLMAVAYSHLKLKDYESMRNVDGSVAADNLVQVMRDRGMTTMLYSPDYNGEDDYTGEALGVYIVPEGYYFFYGEYKNGVRDGYGCSFWVSGEYYYEFFEGDWKDDAPDGYGVQVTVNEGAGYEDRVSGKYTAGHQDGNMLYERIDTWDGSSYTYNYTAKDGDADAIKVNPTSQTYLTGDEVPYAEINGEYIYYYPDSQYLAPLGFRYR